MEVDAVLGWMDKGMTKPLFKLAGTEVTILSIVVFLIIIAGSVVLSYVIQRASERAFAKRFAGQEGTFEAIKRLIHYMIMLVGFGIGLQTIGIDMSALFAAGAVFAIAIGFAMQNVIQNFVSGIILLVERSIKPGDILEVDGNVVKVMDMRIRTTVVRTWRDEDLIIPNAIFSQATVKNFTMKDSVYSTGVSVGVSYSSDMAKVKKVLLETANAMPWKLKGTEPRVMMQEFGDSSVNFSVFLSLSEPWRQRLFMAELREAIWFAFKEAGIVIAFPQVDVHLDAPVSEALSNLGKAAVN